MQNANYPDTESIHPIKLLEFAAFKILQKSKGILKLEPGQSPESVFHYDNPCYYRDLLEQAVVAGVFNKT